MISKTKPLKIKPLQSEFKDPYAVIKLGGRKVGEKGRVDTG
jgi:hypothetical protein